MNSPSDRASSRHPDQDVRHELGNASLLLDAAISLLAGHDSIEDSAADLETVVQLLNDVKRRIDQIDQINP